MTKLSFEVSAPKALTLSVERDDSPLSASIPGFAVARGLPEYTGRTVIIPSGEEQTLDTHDKALRSDIVVAAIPSNYGLIEWDGSVLTVS